MKFAEISIVRLSNDVITASGFNAAECDCYDLDVPGDPCNDET